MSSESCSVSSSQWHGYSEITLFLGHTPSFPCCSASDRPIALSRSCNGRRPSRTPSPSFTGTSCALPVIIWDSGKVFLHHCISETERAEETRRPDSLLFKFNAQPDVLLDQWHYFPNMVAWREVAGRGEGLAPVWTGHIDWDHAELRASWAEQCIWGWRGESCAREEAGDQGRCQRTLKTAMFTD